MAIIVVGVSVLLLIAYLALEYVFTRYHHTRKSRMVLAIEGLACLGLGVFLGFGLPEISWYYHVAFAFLIALPAFSVVSLITVEAWHRFKQGEADSQVDTMRGQMQDLQDESELLSWQIENYERRKKQLEREHDEDLFRQRKLQNEIHDWQSGSGMERIRSLRVENWSEEFSSLSVEELRREREALREQLDDGTESDREESLRVKLALVELEYLRRKMEEPNQKLRELKENMDEFRNRKARVDAEIGDLDSQIRSHLQDRDTSEDRKIELR